MTKLVPVILSGGSGTRLWPLSTPDRPKQFLPLVGERTMLQETAARVADTELFAAPLVVCNDQHSDEVTKQLSAVDVIPQGIILEPVGRNTAPAIAIAAHWLLAREPDAIMLVLPSDHLIADVDAFHKATVIAGAAARSGRLCTFGLKPTAPETGYGYIRVGPAVSSNSPVYEIAEFVEKPDLATAEKYFDSSEYLWNSGMFVLPAKLYADELDIHEAEMSAKSQFAYGRAAGVTPSTTIEPHILRLHESTYDPVPSKSVDYAVMEKTDRAVVVKADIGWSDVGSWASLYEILQQNKEGNATAGEVIAIDTRGCYLNSDGPLVAAVGVEDLVVVATKDAVLIVPRSQSQRVREVVDALKERAKA